MDLSERVQERLEELLGGAGTVHADGEVLHATWVDGPSQGDVAEEIEKVLGKYTGSSSVEGTWSYTFPAGKLVLRREYTAAAIGTTVLMQHLLWGCDGCERSDKAALTVTLAVGHPQRPSSHKGSARALVVGGEVLERQYRDLGELLGVLADTSGNPYSRCRTTREYLCRIGHLEGLVERAGLLRAGMGR